jgi:DNA repair protein RecN (Recombination protein N)
MAEVVADVGQPSSLRSGGRRYFQRLAQGQVGGVRFVPQGVDDQHGNPGDLLHHVGRDMVAIAEVGGEFAPPAGKNVPVHQHFAVRNFGRGDFDVAHGERRRDFPRVGTHVVAESVLAVERVVKNASQVGHGVRRRVDRHGTVGQFAKTPEVVKARHVVGMRVGEHRGVDPPQSVSQGLGAQVRSGVHEEDRLRGFHQDGRSQTAVAFVLGPADTAIAGHERDALGRAGAEKRDRKFGHDGKGHLGIRCGVVATLASLRIKNLALVEDLVWEPGPGMVAITGETGAGKSILIGALQLLLGGRADKSLIRAGTGSCAVEAVFAVSCPDDFDALLEGHGAEPCADGQLLVKRTISSEGGGRQFINGSACTLALLKALGDLLVDLHGPHDHQSLFCREAQTGVLDAFAGAEEMAASYAGAHRRVQKLAAEAAELRAAAQDLAARHEMLAHTAREIASAHLRAGEDEDVMGRLRAAGQGQRLGELSAQILACLGADGEGGARQALAGAVKAGRELARLDPRAAALGDSLGQLAETVSDLEREAARYAEGIESDPGQLQELEKRADVLQGLKRKYGPSLDDVMARGEKAARELEELDAGGGRLDKISAEQKAAAEEAGKLARKLTAARNKAAPALAEAVTKELRDLGFLRAGFAVRLEALDEPKLSGAETAEFEFAPNPGEPAKPLRSIASSGEISRVMLALKSVLASQDRVPLLVFDEIDANVGGEVAVKVGQKMRGLAKSHQILCITHLPQVAAAAARQFAVGKKYDGQRTTTAVDLLAPDERERELARMLGGTDSDSALAHARSLLAAG